MKASLPHYFIGIVNSTAELIGGTPIVKLNRLQPEHAAQVYLKLESFNPSGSVKDRCAADQLRRAVYDFQGRLIPFCIKRSVHNNRLTRAAVSKTERLTI
jgi:hypothetical protein